MHTLQLAATDAMVADFEAAASALPLAEGARKPSLQGADDVWPLFTLLLVHVSYIDIDCTLLLRSRAYVCLTA